MEPCPCGKDLAYSECCEPYIKGEAIPQSPELLMRSRYTAYTQSNIPYIASTMRETALTGFDPEEAKRWADSIDWKRLHVHETSENGSTGVVAFTAYFESRGKEHSMFERSFFKKDGEHWFYVGKEGTRTNPNRDIGRNDPCPCGSGKKFKKCCMNA